jgi:ABC-type branched-subunit amino acid transport system substrate-binding protein
MVCVFWQNALAHDGSSIGRVTETEIVIGMSNALSGPAEDLGLELRTGAKIYFDKVNANGGVAGRKITLINYDDGYEPVRTIKNTLKLLNEDEVFALFGYVGTPTSKVAAPIAARAQVPYFAPFTGAEFLRDPPNDYLHNIRASYFDETEALVEYLVETLNITRIGMFIQDDGYGSAGRSGGQRALEKRGLSMAGVGKYTRNTRDVQKGLDELKQANPQAVIMIGAYAPCAAFMRLAIEQNFKPVFMNISFVGSNALAKAVGAAGEGSYISQVVPHPVTSELPVAKSYRLDMALAGVQELSFTSFEGYLDALVFVEVLRRVGRDLTRENFIAELKKFDMDIGGLQVDFTGERLQGLKEVYLTQIRHGVVVSAEGAKQIDESTKIKGNY